MRETAPRRRRSLTFPLLVIAAGVYLLAYNLGAIDVGPWHVLATWWPLFLVAAGLDLVLGRLRGWLAALISLVVLLFVALAAVMTGGLPGLSGSGSRVEAREISLARDGAVRAVVDLRLADGRGRIAAAPPGTDTILQGRAAVLEDRDFRARVRDTDGTRLITVRGSSSRDGVTFLGLRSAQEWDLNLTPDLPLELEVEGRALDLEMDLSALAADRVDADVVAGTLDITLPAASRASQVHIRSVLGSLIVRVPVTTAVRINTDRALASLRFRNRSLTRLSDTLFESPGYDSASVRTEVFIRARLAHIDIR